MINKQDMIQVKSLADVPWDAITTETGVFIPIEDVNENSLRTGVCNSSKRLNKQFKCKKHADYGFFEIRLSDTNPKPISNVIKLQLGQRSDLAISKLSDEFARKQNFRLDEIPTGKSLAIACKDVVNVDYMRSKIEAFNATSVDKTLILVVHVKSEFYEIGAFEKVKKTPGTICNSSEEMKAENPTANYEQPASPPAEI